VHLSRFEPPECKFHALFSALFLCSFLDYSDSSVNSVDVNVPCEISGFRRSVDEDFASLVCYAAYVGGLPTFWDSVLVPSSMDT
jgi:hypothetical protein